MRWIWVLAVLLPWGGVALARDADAPPAGRVVILNYHDVGPDVASPPRDDMHAVGTGELAAQFQWLHTNGWHPVSVDDLLAARAGERPLPERAVLLTFDDGYAGFHSQVFPLLELFNFPAVLALVGEWLEVPDGQEVDYGGTPVPRERFLTWSQVREMQDSGRVEIASHGFGLHRGIPANAQGNLLPAAVTPRFDPADGYENAAVQVARVTADLARNQQLLARHTGRAPRVLVWPYGASGGAVQEAAREMGLVVQFGLEHGVATPADRGALKRVLVQGNPDLGGWVNDLRHAEGDRPQRVVQVDMDYVYDPDPAIREANLGALIERVRALGVGTVYLQAFADPDGDGAADEVYFPNRHLPVRADLFGRAAWQLKTRAGVRVYAWMPVLAYHPPEGDGRTRVAAIPHGAGHGEPRPYHRLSPFDPDNRAWIGDLYEDLARHAAFDGILFHDDAVLSDFEDASPAALAHYRDAWGLPADVARIRADPALAAGWSRHKSEFLADFTDELTRRATRWRMPLATARNLYARVVLEPGAEAWFAQSLPLFLERYDHTALMAMPFMEQARHPARWLRRLARTVAAHPGGMQRTVFELQSVNWENREPVPAGTLVAQMILLSSQGARNLGYYPDDFPRGLPSAQPLRAVLSTRQPMVAP
ncbi:MAG: poly-beta-1,6-N-acetyl-D-glucosamine N-deacetylase PgaB [Nitrospirota bacterium]|nr:poly-beta-1,6-N-acetyl-D-glucosamine N-deacetylase PgaB [Nitrospirota bacterium]